MRKTLQRMLGILVLCAMLAGSLTIPAAAAGFQDVPANHWAGESIRRCVENGFFKGQTETRFGLGQNMSRSAFAVVLCRFFGWETGVPTEQTYSDVPVDAWYAGAVEAAYKQGALTRQPSTFRPNDPITREELTVMLVRALGYDQIAGLAQDLPMPFEDVTTNGGYITMAYDLGVVNGTTATTFSPDRTATREQVAVMLMRLYDKLNAAQPETIGIVSEMSDLTGLDIAAIPAARAFSFGIKEAMASETLAEIRTAVHEAGVKEFLYMHGAANLLGKESKELSAMMAEAVKNGGYDGLILDIPQVAQSKAPVLSEMVQLLGQQLGDIPFYLVVEAPSRAGKNYGGYEYATLAAAADKLILRVAAVEQATNDFATAPVSPPEELHYAVASVTEQVGVERLSVMLDSELYSWTRSNRLDLSAADLEKLLAADSTQTYHSDRYVCSYLISGGQTGTPTTVWYLTQQDVESRVQLIKSMGIDQICVSDWDKMTEAFAAGLK